MNKTTRAQQLHSIWASALGLAAMLGGACASSAPQHVEAAPAPQSSAAPEAVSCAGITVFFETGSDELGLAGDKRVDELAQCLEGSHVQEIVVTGRADPTGKAEQNDALSMRRAERVVAALEARGISTELLVIQAYGESDASQLAVMWPYERRTEVEVTAQQPVD